MVKTIMSILKASILMYPMKTDLNPTSSYSFHLPGENKDQAWKVITL